MILLICKLIQQISRLNKPTIGTSRFGSALDHQAYSHKVYQLKLIYLNAIIGVNCACCCYIALKWDEV